MDSVQIRSSFNADLITDSGKIQREDKGIIVLNEDSLIFRSKSGTKEIPYTQIASVEVLGNSENGIPKFPGPDFTTKKKASSSVILLLSLLFLFLSIFLLYLFGFKSSSPYVEIHFDTGRGLEKAAFKMSRGDVAKIYPLLIEKIY